jgi:hypothetical protein
MQTASLRAQADMARQRRKALKVCATATNSLRYREPNLFIMARFENLMKMPSTTLVHVLIGKSIAETLLVGALAVFAFLTILPPYFHGWGEVTDTGISGWVVNNATPWDRLEVELFVDGKYIAARVANESRPDVAAAGWAKDEWHGYKFPLTSLSAGLHEARVYALHASGGGTRRSLQLVGDPIRFSVAANGKLRAVTR